MNTVQKRTVQAWSLCALVMCGGQAFGQVRPQRPGNGFGQRSLFRTIFTQAWTMQLDDPVKLIEVGQVTDNNKRVNLLMLVGGKDVSDYKRKLLVTHWANGQFNVDEQKEFPGATVDALLVGPVSAGHRHTVGSGDASPNHDPGRQTRQSASETQTSSRSYLAAGGHDRRSLYLAQRPSVPPLYRAAQHPASIWSWSPFPMWW